MLSNGLIHGGRGFTLVEVIIVAVIVSVLAAVGIPMYRGYLRDSRVDLAKQHCQMIGAAVMQARNRGVTLTGSWSDLGIENPSDSVVWIYAYDSVQVSANGTGDMSGFSGTFEPYKSAASRWGGDFAD